MKMKVSEVIGSALDYMVAKCEGFSAEWDDVFEDFWLEQGGVKHTRLGNYQPSANWSMGGPIIEREGITIVRCDDAWGADERGFCNGVHIPVWAATTGQHSLFHGYDEPEPSFSQYESEVVFGPTPLVAAMRCFCTAKLGDKINVPEELCK